ncbi:MAG TPA: hypothetical protein VMW78_09960 [Anaerolineae bacterium]|nr:hypothetical protein [Anaerolineae bacterium]
MDIHDLLNGKELNRENIRELERSRKRDPLKGVEDAEFFSATSDALKELDKQDDLLNVSILKEDSFALNMAADDVLDFDFIVRAKQNPKYLDPNHRDYLYVRAVDAAVKELGAKRDAALKLQSDR